MLLAAYGTRIGAIHQVVVESYGNAESLERGRTLLDVEEILVVDLLAASLKQRHQVCLVGSE